MVHKMKFKFLLCISLVVLLAVSGAFAQGRISRANQAAAGQKVIFTVVGSSTPVCLDLAQLDFQGNLLTFSSYYIGALKTTQVYTPTLATYKTTTIFAISEPASQNAVTACQSVPGSFINDPAREPRIFEQLVGGSGGNIGVSQANLALAITAAICSQSQNQYAQNDNTQNNNATGGSGRLSPAVIVAPVNTNVPVTTQIQAQACAAVNSTSVAQVNLSSVKQVAIFGFEELSFDPAGGNIFAALLGNCSAPKVNTAGASFIVTCAFPSGGTFSDQSFH
jgi:hypothetical protein